MQDEPHEFKVSDLFANILKNSLSAHPPIDPNGWLI
jgi:hypothetical protein